MCSKLSAFPIWHVDAFITFTSFIVFLQLSHLNLAFRRNNYNATWNKIMLIFEFFFFSQVSENLILGLQTIKAKQMTLEAPAAASKSFWLMKLMFVPCLQGRFPPPWVCLMSFQRLFPELGEQGGAFGAEAVEEKGDEDPQETVWSVFPARSANCLGGAASQSQK